MEVYQQRVVDEKTELDIKISKLDSFVGTEKFFALPIDEQKRLGLQCWFMDEYSRILGERIANFK